MIFPRVHYKAYMIKGALDGTVGLATQNGWMTSDIFLDVVNHIRRFTLASRENPILLMLDNHDSHLSFNVMRGITKFIMSLFHLIVATSCKHWTYQCMAH